MRDTHRLGCFDRLFEDIGQLPTLFEDMVNLLFALLESLGTLIEIVELPEDFITCPSRHLFAVAGNEGNSSAFVEQLKRVADGSGIERGYFGEGIDEGLGHCFGLRSGWIEKRAPLKTLDTCSGFLEVPKSIIAGITLHFLPDIYEDPLLCFSEYPRVPPPGYAASSTSQKG